METDEADTLELGILTEPIEDPTPKGASRVISTTDAPTTRELRVGTACQDIVAAGDPTSSGKRPGPHAEAPPRRTPEATASFEVRSSSGTASTASPSTGEPATSERSSGVTTSTESWNSNEDDESGQKSKDQVPESMSVTDSVRKVNPVRRELTRQAPPDSRSRRIATQIENPRTRPPNQRA